MVDLSQFNIFSTLGLSSIGVILLVIVIALMILGSIGGGVWYYLQRKQLKYRIPLLKTIGGRTMKVAEYRAKDFKVSSAGDKLWYVPKLKKYISPATIQTAPNEYTHHEREDGEWINIGFPDIDEKMRELGVKFVQQDMRSNRIAIGDILDARFKNKDSFWDKYGHLITNIIFYIIVMTALVVVFYQWGGIIDRTGALLDRIIAYEQMKCPTKETGFVPTLIFLCFRRMKK
jgi:small-conductance mechanosensitive channel